MKARIILKRLFLAGTTALFGLCLYYGKDLSTVHTTCENVICTAGISSNVPIYVVKNEINDSIITKESATTTNPASSKDSFMDSLIPFNGYTKVSALRKSFVNTAQSFEGLIPYSWGGKMTTSPDYSPTKSGLDCSGFVQYIYYLATYSFNEDLGSTARISSSCTQISSDQLKPGDLGVIRLDGSYYTAPESLEKYYSIEDAEAYIEKYNDHLREISWEKQEVEDIIYETIKVEIEDDEEDEDDADSKDDKDSSQNPADADTNASPDSSENTGANSDEEFSDTEDSSDSEEKPKEKEKKYVEKLVPKVIKMTELVSTLNEDDLLTVDDLTLVSNHVGIYVGEDKDGNQIWCHCAGKAFGNTVVIGKYDGFNYFFTIME